MSITDFFNTFKGGYEQIISMKDTIETMTETFAKEKEAVTKDPVDLSGIAEGFGLAMNLAGVPEIAALGSNAD